MGKFDFLDALKRAMTGLAPEIQAKTLAYYEQRFIDGVATGRSEEDISRELDDPKKIAMTLRASTHLKAFEEKKNPANAARMLVAFLGLAIFNLFMVVPAMVYAALLACLFISSIAVYGTGIVVTASGLSGANELVLDGPFRDLIVIDNDDERQRIYDKTRVSISSTGIEVTPDGPDSDQIDEDVREAVGADAAAAVAEAVAEAQVQTDAASVRVIKRAEKFAGRGVVISTDMDDESRATQTVVGLGMVLGGIILFLISLVVARYTLIGIKRYVQMNFSLLRGH